MTLSSFVKKYRPRLATELTKITSFSATYTSSWAPDVEARFQGMAGGKALRGMLTLIGYGAARGTVRAETVHLAAIIELIHAVMLIHDDVMDRDPVRRGKPSAFAQYRTLAGKHPDASHLGMSLAMCAGDIGILHAMRLLSAFAGRSSAAMRAATHVGHCCTETALGQLEDVVLSAGMTPITERAIIRMLIGKTARYSCSMPLVAGAYLGGGSAKLIQTLDALGEDLGLIFQLRDDELGLFGTTEAIGKPAGSDIREGKQTLYRFYLEQVITSQELRRLHTIYGNASATDADFEYVRTLTREYKVDAKVARLVRRREQHARTLLDSLRIPVVYRTLLEDVLSYVTRRAN